MIVLWQGCSIVSKLTEETDRQSLWSFNFLTKAYGRTLLCTRKAGRRNAAERVFDGKFNFT